jgi:hypothetical protein
MLFRVVLSDMVIGNLVVCSFLGANGASALAATDSGNDDGQPDNADSPAPSCRNPSSIRQQISSKCASGHLMYTTQEEQKKRDPVGFWLGGVKGEIVKVWNSGPRELFGKDVVECTFGVQEDGQFYDFKISKSSGRKELDDFVLKVMEHSRLHESTPKEIGDKRIVATFSSGLGLKLKLAQQG